MKRTTSISTERRSSTSEGARRTLEKSSIRAARAWTLARLAVVTIFFTAAPTAGDIGSCGQAAEDLDARKFFQAKDQIDCRRCFECGINTLACERACDLEPSGASFPLGCFPLVHDGEVCLNALDATSCAVYAGYVADQGATAPTECNFCPLDGGK